MIVKLLGGSTAVLGLALLLLWNTHSNLRERHELTTERLTRALQAHENCQEANRVTRQSLDDALAQHRACGALLTDAREAARIAQERLTHASNVFSEAIERERLAREEIFRDEDCRLVGEMDFDVLCPAIGGRLRQLAP